MQVVINKKELIEIEFFLLALLEISGIYKL